MTQHENTTERDILEHGPYRSNVKGHPDKVFHLQQKLYIKAKKEPKFRFYTLYDRVYRKDVLMAAWKLVSINDGAPGVDGVSCEDVIIKIGLEEFVDSIHQDLRNKAYKPSAVRRVYIPKSNGKKRPLGIPTVRDRVVQQAALLVIEPIFEADFLDSSFGFRPMKNAHQALDKIKKNLNSGRRSVYDADLSSYFDTIPHEKLMKCLEKRIIDRQVLKLIRMWLKMPVVEKRDRGGDHWTKPEGKGTPQGGVISPLLANIYLHWFEKRFYGKDGPGHWAGAEIIRYADDFVVLARYISPKLSDWISEMIEQWLGLELNPLKTSTIQLNHKSRSFDFLGYTFRCVPSKIRSGDFAVMYPSLKSMAKQRETIRAKTSPKLGMVPAPQLIQSLSRQIVGWSRYFNQGYHRRYLRDMSFYAMCSVVKHLKRRSQRPYRPPKGVSWYHHVHKQLGLVRL